MGSKIDPSYPKFQLIIKYVLNALFSVTEEWYWSRQVVVKTEDKVHSHLYASRTDPYLSL